MAHGQPVLVIRRRLGRSRHGAREERETGGLNRMNLLPKMHRSPVVHNASKQTSDKPPAGYTANFYLPKNGVEKHPEKTRVFGPSERLS
jgi:hypothetical protein